MSTERWVYLNDEGKLIMHTENDGCTFLRHGPQAHEEEISLEELKNYSERHRKEGLDLLAAYKARTETAVCQK